MPNRHTTLTSLFTDIAGAIRSKTGDSAVIKADDFDTAIEAIPTGGGENTLKKLLDATKSCQYLFNYYNGTSVDDLISYSDTSNVTKMDSMFEECSNLTTVHQLNTSNVTNMSAMFRFCRSLTSIPELDTSKVTTMKYMFQSCFKLTTVPQLNTSNVKDMSYMFQSCSRLTTVPQLDVSNVTNMNNIFANCSSLKSILMTGMKVSFSISASTQFEESDLVTILNNLATVTSTKTLTMGSTNLAKLTDDEKAIATNKGWTLA